ncbi:MAG: hypothetical protein SCK28_01530 [Bacillota bacterium]|nr:hypothetical protein [Bacillota bacterium]
MEERKQPVCPVCETELAWLNKQEFWICRVCNTEVWPDKKKLVEMEKKRIEKEKAKTDRQQLLWSIGKGAATEVLPSGPPAPGSGSRTKSRKKPMKKDKPLEPWKLA